MENVMTLIEEIQGSIKKKSASQKDEVKIMRAMLNDKEYVVDVYDKTGVIGQVCPANDAREMAASIISGATRIPYEEAKSLADNYEFKRNEAASMVEISKEFVNTYLDTGRKISLGGRVDKDISIYQDSLESKEKTYPKRIGEDENGKPKYERPITVIPAHKSAKTESGCPEWLR